jgi:hypothetical protein
MRDQWLSIGVTRSIEVALRIGVITKPNKSNVYLHTRVIFIFCSDAGPSFQIWGEGMRFARVPITSGSYWFAAITSPPGNNVPHLSIPLTPQALFILVDKAGCSSLSQEGISSEEWDALLARLRDMSEPVRSILTQTLGGHRGVLLDQTYATGKLTTNSGSSSTTFGSVALIGDANFTVSFMYFEFYYLHIF